MSKNMRKACVVVTSRASYARIKYLLKAIEESSKLELELIVGASALLYKYGRVIDIIRSDGFEPSQSIHYLVEGENLITQAKSVGMGVSELATAFDTLSPDVVITVADRFETIATAIAASYMNIPLAHIQGGEVSGSIDDSVRHAITKLAHLHYPSTKKSAERIIGMGEESWRVKVTGCPSIDVLTNTDLILPKPEYFKETGTGDIFDPTSPYLLIAQHPVTTSFGQGARQISETLFAAKDIPIQTVVLWPNPDAGSDDVAKEIREFQHNNRGDAAFSFHINFTPEVYASMIANAECLIGNSSSFIREGAFLGTPAVIVGDRQSGREHGRNIIFAKYEQKDIRKKILAQMEHGQYESEHIFGDGNSGKKIAADLETAKLKIVKHFTY